MSVWHETAGNGADLVLLHGWGMNAGVWQLLLPALQERFRVTLIELPGHGASPYEGQAGLDAWVHACLEVAPEQATWVGWSLGGLIAQRAALLAPQRVHQLCLVCSTPSFVQREGWQAAMPANVFDQFAQNLVADPQATLKRFLGLQVKGAKDARPVLRALNEALAQRPAADVEGLRAGLSLLLDTDLREQLAQLSVPVHWLFGGRDTLVPVTVAKAIGDMQLAGTREIIEPAGHAPLLSHPRQSLIWLDVHCG
jgi:pimeloyl-[acyl-carrier protein] methyl ester esterase